LSGFLRATCFIFATKRDNMAPDDEPNERATTSFALATVRQDSDVKPVASVDEPSDGP